MTDELQKPKVLIIDDAMTNIKIIGELLRSDYKILFSLDAQEGITSAAANKPDLILLDILMPVMDGYEACRRLKADEQTRDIPIIFITSKNDEEDETKGFELGAVDYVTKPFSPPKLLARVKTHTALRQARLELQEWNSNLKRKVINQTGLIREKAQEVKELQETSSTSASSLITTLLNILELTDTRHSDHANSVGQLANDAAKRMSLNISTIRDINNAALLHDIGKLSLGLSIANRLPSEISVSELNEYRQHPQRGQLTLKHVEPLQDAVLMIRHHHEAFDGTGFPDGLKGDDIPLGAQLIGIADFIDNAAHLVCEGKKAEYAMKKLATYAGTLFNPRLISYFRTL